MAERVQLSRARGWRMPENTVSVARPTKWGNPYRVTGTPGGAAAAVAMYRDFIGRISRSTIDPKMAHDGFGVWDRNILATIRAELSGKNLACWCPLDQPCHADVLLELANQEESSEP